MDATEFRQELDRRLSMLEDPGHPDSPQDDLPARDLIALLVGSILVIGALLAWGYPW